MDRRDFLKISGVTAAGAALAACAPKGEEAAAGPVGISGEMAQNYPGVGLLGFGCMRWPMTVDDYGNEIIDQDAVNRMVDVAMEHGVNYYDTSPAYLGGESERASAEALCRYPREKWILATKLSNFMDCSYDNSVLMYRRSLEIFKTDYIDYYLLHSISGKDAFDKRYGSTGIMDFLLAEREAGHIRNLGFSFHGPKEGLDELLALQDKYHWDFVQIQMNYPDWYCGDAEYLYNALDAAGLPVVIMEPLLGGRLSSIPAPLEAKLKAREPGRSAASWAFRFCGSYPRILTVLSGMTYMEHLQDNLSSFCGLQTLSDDDKALLAEVAESYTKYPLVPCTGCQYCMPCPYGIDIPGIFAFYNKAVNEDSYVKSKEQKDFARARRRYLAAYDKAVESIRQADHCISCGKCMKECPQRIRIPRQLQRIDQYVEALKQGTLE